MHTLKELIINHDKLSSPIISVVAGSGQITKSAVASGADLIIALNAGLYRNIGLGSLAAFMPYGNANDVVKEMAYEILPAVKKTPVLAGVCGTDPFMLRDSLLKELKHMGFAGIQNFPTVGLIDGVFRANLEETGMSYKLEVECIKAARSLDMLTTPYVFNTDEAIMMTEAGADIIVAHMGLTTNGIIGAKTSKSMDECIIEIQKIAHTCKSINSEVIVLCHGGPIATPEDAQYVLNRVLGIDGFYGASSMERLPTEIAITEQIKKFKSISFKPIGFNDV
jgi:predicted TIM-barrel enzyme